MLPEDKNIHRLTDHLFRRISGKMVAVLTGVFGAGNLEVAEDVVQQSFIEAINNWKLKGIPDDPSAWLFRVAKNKAIDVIRRNKHTVYFDFSQNEKRLLTSEYTLSGAMDQHFSEAWIKDDMLRMMYACCHPDISAENQITLILKTLCGFSSSEISRAFLTSEDTISKRLYRTREVFRTQKIKLEIPSVDALKSRTDAVLKAIYLLFNEGYSSTHSEGIIRKDLVEEAIVLCRLLVENKHTQLPEPMALMALMKFHQARMSSRISELGELILLSDQDRSQWDQVLIAEGNAWMNSAAFGDQVSTYHLEAAITWEHCIAPTFEETNWHHILKYYDWLCLLTSSPIHALNRSIAVWKAEGPTSALKALTQIQHAKLLEDYYLYYAVRAELQLELGKSNEARGDFQTALKLTNSKAEQIVLQRKMDSIQNL
ncbi:MAG: RNA polymerase sigma factor [Flavobacteriales bacterium]